MIENKNEASRSLEKALQAMEQAKQRTANEKKFRRLTCGVLSVALCERRWPSYKW